MDHPYLDFPLSIDGRGRVATTAADDHVRDMIQQVLFTNPGERVNRPDFGCGLLQMVFLPASDVLATATEFIVQGALQRWLGDVIQVERVAVQAAQERLEVVLTYRRLDTGQRQQDRFAAPQTTGT